jgi:hypothetical protein
MAGHPIWCEKCWHEIYYRTDECSNCAQIDVNKRIDAIEQIKPLIIHWMYKPNSILYRKVMKSFMELKEQKH